MTSHSHTTLGTFAKLLRKKIEFVSEDSFQAKLNYRLSTQDMFLVKATCEDAQKLKQALYNSHIEDKTYTNTSSKAQFIRLFKKAKFLTEPMCYRIMEGFLRCINLYGPRFSINFPITPEFRFNDQNINIFKGNLVIKLKKNDIHIPASHTPFGDILMDPWNRINFGKIEYIDDEFWLYVALKQVSRPRKA